MTLTPFVMITTITDLKQEWKRKNKVRLIFEKETLGCPRGATSSSFRRGGNFHEILFDDVIVLIQPRYNFSANGHR